MRTEKGIKKLKSSTADWFKRQDNTLGVFDWVMFAVLALFCYVSFVQSDIIVTGNRSWQIFESSFFNFYDVMREFTQNDGANYMPTTFILFAVWVLPLKLLGFAPPMYRTSRLLYVMWYQLLPTLFFIGSAYLVYRIAVQIGMSKQKSKICMFSFITFPVAFYSQFIFSQYDSFTVFFMLWGIYYYLRDVRNDKWKFCACFGVAITFKYFAAVIFLVLLLLREKRVWEIFKQCIVAAALFVIEFLMFFRSEGFMKGVFGFRVLEYASKGDFTSALGEVSFFQVALVLIVAWAYFTKLETRDDLIRWAFYLCCGVCCALFALMTWHPQWLIFAAPFWVISIYIHRDTEKFLWFDCAFLVAFYTFIFGFESWVGNIDDEVLCNGVFKYLIDGLATQKHMGEFMPMSGSNMMYAVVIAIIIIYFVFKHPKNTLQDLSYDDGSYHMWLIRFRLALTVVLFAVPAFLSLLNTVKCGVPMV